MQADMGFQKSLTCWEIKEVSEEGKLLIAITPRTDCSKPSSTSQGGEGGCSAPWGSCGICKYTPCSVCVPPVLLFPASLLGVLGPPNPHAAQGSVMWICFWAFPPAGPGCWSTWDSDHAPLTEMEDRCPKPLLRGTSPSLPYRVLPALDPPCVRAEAYTI